MLKKKNIGSLKWVVSKVEEKKLIVVFRSMRKLIVDIYLF